MKKDQHKQDHELQISVHCSLCNRPAVPCRKDSSPSALITLCLSGHSLFLFAGVSHPEDEAGMPFFSSSTSKSASLPFCPPRRHQLSNGAVLELGTDDSRTLVITKIFINLKCQPLLLSQPSQTCLESKWCLSLASYMGDSAAHRLTSI